MIRKWLARFSAQGDDSQAQEAEALVQEGDAAFLRDDFPAAEAHYRQAIGLVPDLVSAHLGLGATLRVMGRLDEAVAALHGALKIDDALRGAHELLAACHLAQSDLARAEPHLCRAIALKPSAESNYLDLGALLVNQRRYEEAAELVRQGIAVDSGFADLQLFQANLCYETGQFERAVVAYRTALKLKPGQLLALHNLGLALFKTSEFEAGREAFARAVELNPQWADAHNNLGYAYYRTGKFGDAEASFECALAIDPGLAMAHLNAGELASSRGEIDRAIVHYRKAVGIDPDMAQAHVRLGIVLSELGQRDDAIAHLEHGREIAPDNVEALGRLAKLYFTPDNAARSLSCYREIVAVDPDHVEALAGIGSVAQWLAEHAEGTSKSALLNEGVAACQAAVAREPDHLQVRLTLGALLGQSGKLDEADQQFEAVLLCEPNNVNARHNLGVSMESRARLKPLAEKLALFERALEHYQIALAAEPRHLDALMGIAAIHGEQLRAAEAAQAYERLLQIDPDYAPARMSYGMLKLKIGDFAAGWNDFESRWRMSKWAPIRLSSDQPQWSKGISLTGKTIIVYHEQGLGDSLQFIRYAAKLAELGARVLVKAPLALKPLFAACAGVHAVIEGDALPPHDFHCSLMSLPWAFDTRLDTIPAALPYLRASPERIAHWREKFGANEALRVGLVWAGDARMEEDYLRSLHVDCLRPLLDVPGVSFYSIQVGKEARAQLSGVPQVVDFADELFDFQETAALVDNLDLVIGVDTSSAHLVGALGKPVWLLNRFNTCWRWMLERTDSPWYPTMRIFRQPKPGDWDSVIAEVKPALEELARRKQQV